MKKPDKPRLAEYGWTMGEWPEPYKFKTEGGEMAYNKALKKWMRTVKRKKARRVQIMIARSYDLKAQECIYKSKAAAINTKP